MKKSDAVEVPPKPVPEDLPSQPPDGYRRG